MDQDAEPQPQSVQRDRPARPDAETREETIARVVDETEAVSAERGGSPDPSTRRGVQRTLVGALVVFGAIGAVAGGVLGLVLSLLPGPFETSSVSGAIGYIAVMAAGGALIGGVIGALVTLAREDGRVEREVEEETGRGPEGAASPSAPEHDLTER
jgi:hypothetical protein